jgi:putative autoinducer-2 (AI-2) aldolase
VLERVWGTGSRVSTGTRGDFFGMDWGMKNRLARIIKPESGRTVMLAVDHGYFLGPTHRLEEPKKTIEPLLPYADALMVTRGVLRTSVDPSTNSSIVLRVSGGTSVIGSTLTNEGIITSVKDAIRLNVAAVALSIFVGTEHEKQTLLNLANLVNEGEEYGIPVLAVTAVGKELEKRDARYLSLCCRIAAELGAHMVKTYYCEDFEKVVRGCPVPIVVAGGPKLNTEADALRLAYEAITEGAIGVDMGRNIWQSDNPVAMIKAIRSIVHERTTVKEALDVFNKVKKVETHSTVEEEPPTV